MTQAPMIQRVGDVVRRGRPTTVMGRKIVINLIILIALGIALSILSDHFLSSANVWNVLRQTAVIVIVGAAMTLVMVAGGLDLSIGGVVALSGVAAVTLANSGVPVVPACAIAVVLGALVGLINGVLVVGIGINSVIATLGTMYVTRGVALLWTGGQPVEAPRGFSELGTGYIAGVPIPVILMFAVVVLFVFVERRTILGRRATAVGSNEEAAFLCGIPVKRTKMMLFVLTGAAAGFGGVIIASRFDAAVPNTAQGFEFDVIVATVLGGTALTGGEGSVVGMFLGALIVGVLSNGLNILGVASFWQTVVEGIVLVMAVGLDILLRGGRISWPPWLPRWGGPRVEVAADPSP